MSGMKDANAAGHDNVGNSEPMDQSGDNAMPSAQQQEQVIKKKFGGLIPKKPPLISKDHERAYFDSADWALGKVLNYPSVASVRFLFVQCLSSNELFFWIFCFAVWTARCCKTQRTARGTQAKVAAHTTTATAFKELYLQFIRKRGWRWRWVGGHEYQLINSVESRVVGEKGPRRLKKQLAFIVCGPQGRDVCLRP
ncbi:uncharacterized protein [Triticum aestivum]|uniref:uncharacterized protein isoform X1 n=1 Tax=Triticum aestivum TaxID=4565 RepID=UPI001D00E75F|nr:uncharacterized protein LOC123060912 isoform X1 [Triticum aestivum]